MMPSIFKCGAHLYPQICLFGVLVVLLDEGPLVPLAVHARVYCLYNAAKYKMTRQVVPEFLLHII